MVFFRAVVIALALAFLAVAGFKITRGRQQDVQQPVDARRVSTRQFWDSYRRASQRRAANEFTEALAFYREALVLKPGHEDSLYYSGNCYQELGNYREAIAAYERLIEVSPLGSSRGYVQLALVYSCLDPEAPLDLDQAESFFQKALRVDPDSGALLGIGEVALLRGQWLKASEALHSDAAGNPMSMATPYLLGYLHWRNGERKEAWRWFRLAVQRGELKKPPVKWTEEGDVKADPALRWKALARQSVLGKYWLRLRSYLNSPDLAPSDMEKEYQVLRDVLATQARRSAKQARNG